MKKLLALLLSVLMLISALPALAEGAEDPVSITIFHTNDVHGRYDTSSGMGYAMMMSFVAETIAADENVLVLDAGDTTHGTVFANTLRGESIIEMMNAVGYAAMAVGNHDFNYGYERALELDSLADFPFLSSNILLDDGSYAFTPYVIVEIAEKQIAIVGAQNPEMETSIHPDYIDGLNFAGVEEVEKVVAEVIDQSDAVIILAHWGCDDAYDPNSAILAAIDGVDLVIDGHSHTQLADIKQTEGAALIASTGEYLNNLGKVTMTFTDEGVVCAAELIADPGRYEDRVIINAIEAIEDAQSEVLDTVIGQTAVELVGEREIVRTQESNWGNLACDIFIESTGADVALMNGGNIRMTVPAGDITVRDINTVYPFGNYVCVIEVTGAILKEALEHGVSNLPETSGGFPQIGGMTMVVDPSREAGSRITELKIGGADYDPEAAYTLATNDYLAAGGDSYDMLATCPMLLEMGFMDEIIIDYIKEAGTVSAELDGRIMIIE